MILYHGSNIKIREIDLSKSKVGKDFGCGFYLSTNKEQAMELAERKTEQMGVGEPTLNTYNFDEDALTKLNILTFDSYSEEWADFVLMNRQNRTRTQAHEYDIVIGPIANDAVGIQIRRFTSGLITKETFLQELKFMKGITIQYFFANGEAIKYLRRL